MAVRHAAALVLVGMWLGLLLASWVSATAAFRGVDRALGPEMRPELKQRIGGLAPAEQRLALRHAAGEINRWMFRRVGLLQLALGALALAAAWPFPVARAVLGAGLLLAVLQVGLGATIESLGRSLDFLARPLPAELGRRFGLLHAAFLLADAAKALLLVAAGALLARRPL
jgi:hypothetical protein